MSDNLRELAEAAQARVDRPVDECLQEFIEHGVKSYRMLMESVAGLYAMDLGGARERYAASLGKEATALTEQEKRQALLNAVLEQSA